MHPVLFFLLFLVVVPFVVLEGAFRLLPVSSPPYILPVTEREPVARFQPNVDHQVSSSWNFAIVTRKRTNNYGYHFAADFRPEETTPLLMMIGDSFVEAQAVDAGKSAAELLHAKTSPQGRVYSIGLSGAPLSQYLVFARFARDTFCPEAMAFVIIGNDFDESLLKYKSDPRFHYFEEKDGGAVLRRIDYELSPAKKLLRQSAFVRYVMLNVAAGTRLEELSRARTARGAEPAHALQERIRDSQRAVDHFLEHLPSMSGLASDAIVFVLDGMRPALYQPESLRLADGNYHAQMRRYFSAAATARGYEVVDMQPAFIARHRLDGSRFEFPTDSHWNELANRLVAEEMEKSAVFQRLFRAPASVALKD